MNLNIKKSLNQCLLTAILHYNDELAEEQGGFILKKIDKEEYQFISVKNENTGTPLAKVLYTANRYEFNNLVLNITVDNEWEVYASFHTHPVGMRAMPSQTDLYKLFGSFPINFIYSPDRELNRFEYSESNGWVWNNVLLFDGGSYEDLSDFFHIHQLTNEDDIIDKG